MDWWAWRFASRAARALDVETFLLSCRVLGRGVEHAILAHLGNLALKQNKRWVNVHFHPSAKNKPALDFLQSVGAAFKQPLNGGFVYAFPSDVAAKIAFNAENAPATAAAIAAPNRSRTARRIVCDRREVQPLPGHRDGIE